MENKIKKKMKKQIYRANNRGSADYGWLKANYSFSFANYFNPDAIQFGALRVLNDDEIAGGKGFPTHPHDNMEIITIPLAGSLKHKDSMANEWKYVQPEEVQVMSAGTGLHHSEMNGSDDPLKLFQIWIIPNARNVKPRYDQKKFNAEDRADKLQVLVSSFNDDRKDDSLKIHQDATLSRISLSEGNTFNYNMREEQNGLYIMTIDGAIQIDDVVLNKRDALGITHTSAVSISAKIKSELLFIEVPMY